MCIYTIMFRVQSLKHGGRSRQYKHRAGATGYHVTSTRRINVPLCFASLTRLAYLSAEQRIEKCCMKPQTQGMQGF